VITGRRKSTFYVTVPNQACSGVPVAATGKVEVPSVSGGYGTADTFSDDRIDAIRQRTSIPKDVSLLGERFLA